MNRRRDRRSFPLNAPEVLRPHLECPSGKMTVMRVELLGPLRALDDSGDEIAVPAGRQFAARPVVPATPTPTPPPQVAAASLPATPSTAAARTTPPASAVWNSNVENSG